MLITKGIMYLAYKMREFMAGLSEEIKAHRIKDVAEKARHGDESCL
jgi:hypothetical protein